MTFVRPLRASIFAFDNRTGTGCFYSASFFFIVKWYKKNGIHIRFAKRETFAWDFGGMTIGID